MTGLFYGLAVLGAFALAIGGVWMWRRNRLHGTLMLLMAAILLFNVWSWSTLPTNAPASRGLAAEPAR